jgi:hypothetical protein
MANLQSIQAKCNYGAGIAARIVGEAVTQFRANNPMAPLDGSGFTSVFNAAFDADPLLTMTKPALVGRCLFYLIANASNLEVGDYLVGPEGQFFVASLEPLRPPVVIRANAVLSLSRPEDALQAGLGPPGGDSVASETTLFAGWPGSVLIAGKSGQGDVDLPGDVGMAGWQILLPYLFGIDIRGSDILTDQAGLRHLVVGAELSPMGWRIDATQEAA